jgi:mannose-6-phosphate isomerase
MFGLLQFEEHYCERLWGGQKLREVYGKDTPTGAAPIGEAWLISDHPECESVVTAGPHAGQSLHALLQANPAALLGSRARPTIHGRFPLLLKLLDSAQALSVQVHPDDDDAKRLGEPDVGKTEMWHVLHADPGAELICGLSPDCDREALRRGVEEGTVETLMTHFEAPSETSVFVPAGTVHAIGAGFLLAEIQQNSDITYRLYDWMRTDAQGQPRELHLDKALEVTHYDSAHGGPSKPLAYERGSAHCEILAVCPYFAAEKIRIQDAYTRKTRGESFHILLATAASFQVRVEDSECALEAGGALLIPGAYETFTAQGSGTMLDFHVPDLSKDIEVPLHAAGHELRAIRALTLTALED